MGRFSVYLPLLLAAVSNSPVIAVPAGGPTCNQNPVVEILSVLKLSSFCSQFIPASTQTLSATATSAITSTVTSTVGVTTTTPITSVTSVTVTSTTTQDASGAPGTDTTTYTSTITPPAIISTVTVTDTLTSTSTIVSQVNQRRSLEKLNVPIPQAIASFAESVVSSACSCYIGPRQFTTTKTRTIYPTSTVVASVSSTSTLTNVVTTLIATLTATSTAVSTVIPADVTATITVTTTLPAITNSVTATDTVTVTTTTTSISASFTPVIPPSNSTAFVTAPTSLQLQYWYKDNSGLTIDEAGAQSRALCVSETNPECMAYEVIDGPASGGDRMWCVTYNTLINTSGEQYPYILPGDIGTTQVAAYKK